MAWREYHEFTKHTAEKPVSYTHLEEIDDVKLQSPAEYKIETVPPAHEVKKGPLSYEISAASQENSVEVKRHLVLGGMIYPVNSYPALRSFFNSVKSNDGVQIVFQNTQSAKNN